MQGDAPLPSPPRPLDYETPGAGPPRDLRPLDPFCRRSGILGALFFATPIPPLLAIVFGTVGLRRVRDGRSRGRVHAIVGTSMGILGLLGWSVFAWGAVLSHHAMYEVWCGNHLRAVAHSMFAYASQNNGQLPPDLGALLGAGEDDVPGYLLVCPEDDAAPAAGPTTQAVIDDFRSGRHSSYVYLGAGLRTPVPATHILAFEPVAHHRHGVHVLYGDGHVGRLTSEELLLELQRIEQLRQWKPKPTTRPAPSDWPWHAERSCGTKTM